jgi:NAD(P)-dependent dehydrogenase (short-subunit alcohol dehydrogenase family)
MKKQLNKKALVTGGNSGIGFATAKELISEGANVMITGRNKSAVERAAKEIGAIGVVSDQSRLADIDSLFTTAKNEFEKNRHTRSQRRYIFHSAF